MKESLDISKDNLQDAAKSCNNCNEPNMKEILLIKCDTTIYADEITNLSRKMFKTKATLSSQ